MSSDETSPNAFDELIKNAIEQNKKRKVYLDDYCDEQGLKSLIRERIFRDKVQEAGYSIIEGGTIKALDLILKTRLKEFIKMAVTNSELRNGEQLTKQDALDVVRQTNYFDSNKMEKMFFTESK